MANFSFSLHSIIQNYLLTPGDKKPKKGQLGGHFRNLPRKEDIKDRVVGMSFKTEH